MLFYPVQVTLADRRSAFVVRHDHLITDALAHVLRIVVPMGALVLCAIALALFRSGNRRRALLDGAKRD